MLSYGVQCDIACSVLQLVSDVGDDTREKKLHYYLQKTIDGSTDTEKYAYDGGIMLVELGYEV